MSAARQYRVPERDANTAAYLDHLVIAPVPPPDNPLQLLRDAIAQLKSQTGALPDQQQVANLLAEAREALERANVVARAVTQCDAHLSQGRFEQAFEALGQGLAVYPSDPILTARQGAVEAQQKAFHSAAAVRGAIEEAKWLLEQDRTDLAAQFLKEKAAELPDQQELAAHLIELEALLPEWEQRREVQDALVRAQTLEQLQQWQAALTVIEEALQAYPSNETLQASADRIRESLVEHQRRRKLARRIELIRQQIVAGSWRNALTLLDNTQLEFAGASELRPLRDEITAGLRRSECEDTVAEIRKCLADGELEQAERVLQRGLEGLGPNPALDTVRKELEAEKHYRDQMRNAQVLFGRRQLEHAERVLTKLLDQDRPEAKALLEAVRAARAAAEEESFLDRGREKALDLIQQEQFATAADLLRNLLTLSPGNPILERDLAAAQTALEHARAAVAAPVEPAEAPPLPVVEQPVAPLFAGTAAAAPSGRLRRVAVAGAASLVLASGAAWKLSQRAAPAPAQVAPPSSSSTAAAAQPDSESSNKPFAVQASIAELPVSASSPSEPAAAHPTSARVGGPAARNKPAAAPPRFFVPPSASPSAARNRNALPLPPGSEPNITITSVSNLPAAITTPFRAPAPPSPVVRSNPAPPPKPAPPTGGQIEQAELIKRVLPAYPALAHRLAVNGVVRLTAVIDEHGNVKDVKVLSGDVVLAASARDAVLLWKYKPATLNGHAVPSMAEIAITFRDRDN
ncbi:MAG TPA: TonB family protein [Bryobacteraceae bacterium]|nr:TonB family protein [Bryobacteraceae bacterium]